VVGHGRAGYLAAMLQSPWWECVVWYVVVSGIVGTALWRNCVVPTVSTLPVIEHAADANITICLP